MGNSKGRVDLIDKYDNVNTSVLAGKLHQVAIDAIEKEMKTFSEVFYCDEAYWMYRLTLELSELSSDFVTKLRTIIVTDKDIKDKVNDNEVQNGT